MAFFSVLLLLLLLFLPFFLLPFHKSSGEMMLFSKYLAVTFCEKVRL